MAKRNNRTRDEWLEIIVAPAIASGIGAIGFAIGNQNPLIGAGIGAGIGLGIEYLTLRKSQPATQNSHNPRLPYSFNATIEEGGYINRGSFLDIFRSNKRQPIKGNSHQMPLPPLEIAEFMFRSAVDVSGPIYNVQLPDSFVRRFLRYAAQRPKRGKGLSRNNWVNNGLCDPIWYDAVWNLLMYAQSFRGLQIVLQYANNQSRLTYNWYTTYAYLRLVESEKPTS